MVSGKRIEALFSLKSGESQTVFLLISYSFVISVGLYIYYTAATTLFLSNFSNKDLPVAYIAGGVLVFLIGKSNLYIQSKILYSTLSKWLVIGLTIVAGLLLYSYFIFQNKWIVFALFLLIRANLFVFSFTFWIAASKIFNLEQAKRLFGLLGTGEVVASTIANFLVSYLVSHKLLTVEGLLVIAIGCIAASIFFYAVIQQKYNQLLAFRKAPVADGAASAGSIFTRQTSQYHLFVYLLAALPIVCLYLIEYIFSVDSKAQYTDKEQLAAFIGQFLFTCSIIELIIKSFLYQFITNLFGVSSSLIVLPVALLIIAVAILLLYTADINIFFLVLMSRFFITSVRRSFSDTSFQLLYQPLPHTESIHLQNLVEIYIKPLGYIFAGGSLIFLTSSGFKNSTDVFSLLLIYLVVWLVIAYLMRNEYKEKIISFLANRTPLLTSIPALAIKPVTGEPTAGRSQADVNELVKLAGSPLAADRLQAARQLRSYRLIKTDKLIIKLLNDPSEAVRQPAIVAAANTTKPEVWEHVIPNLFIDACHQTAHEALSRIGEPVLPLLGRCFNDKSLKTNDLTALIQVITTIGGLRAIHILRKLMEGQPAGIRLQLYRSLLQLGYQATIRERSLLLNDIDGMINRYLRTLSAELILSQPADHSFSLLIKAITLEREETLDGLLILLSLYYNDDKFLYVKELIQQKNKQSRGYLNEILNLLISEELKAKLLPLFEDATKEEILTRLEPYFPQQTVSVTDCLFDLANRSDQEVHLITKALAIKQMHQFSDDNVMLTYATHAASKHKIISELCLYSLYLFQPEKFNSFYRYFSDNKQQVHVAICNDIISNSSTHLLEVCKVESLLQTDVFPDKYLDKLYQISANMEAAILASDTHVYTNTIKQNHPDFSGIILTKGRLQLTPINNDFFFMDAPNYYLYTDTITDMKAIGNCAIYYICMTDTRVAGSYDFSGYQPVASMPNPELQS